MQAKQPPPNECFFMLATLLQLAVLLIPQFLEVDKGSTVTDYLDAERQRGITITSACIPMGLLYLICSLEGP